VQIEKKKNKKRIGFIGAGSPFMSSNLISIDPHLVKILQSSTNLLCKSICYTTIKHQARSQGETKRMKGMKDLIELQSLQVSQKN
jgi:hypothetical protein